MRRYLLRLAALVIALLVAAACALRGRGSWGDVGFLLWIVPASLVVVGATIVFVGLRGRRVDDHPICRTCGFDLFGLPVGAAVCSECGADLSRRRAVRVGRREGRRKLLWLGAPALLTGVGLLGAVGWVAARGADFQRHKPTRWLTREAGGLDVNGRDAALAELTRRLHEKTLTDAQVDEIGERALAHQADVRQPWVNAWGTWLHQAQRAGRLAPEQWQRYARQAPQFQAKVRPVVRRGDPFPVAVGGFPARLEMQPQGWQKLFHINYRWTVTVRGRVIGRSPPGAENYGMLGRGKPGGWLPPPTLVAGPALDRAIDEVIAEGRDAPEPVDVTVDYEVREAPHQYSLDTGQISGNYLAGGQAGFTLPCRFLPREIPSVSVKSDPALRDAVGRALSVGRGGIWVADGHDVQMSVAANNPPVGVAFDVFLRYDARGGTDTKELPMGQVAYPAGKETRRGLRGVVPPDLSFGEPRVDVILRSSTDAAVKSLDVMEIWGEPIIIRGVEVVWSTS
jgi:hypothetical protein